MRVDGFVIRMRIFALGIERLPFKSKFCIPPDHAFERANEHTAGRDYTRVRFEAFDQLAEEFAPSLDRSVFRSRQSQLHCQYVVWIEAERYTAYVYEAPQN